MPGPLEGLRVVDLTQGYVGYCGMICGDLGATVLKIEPPEGDYLRRHGPPFVGKDAAAFVGVNRSKQSICLDWVHDAHDRASFDGLIKSADVVISDLHPDDASLLDFDYSTIAEQHPRLVFCALTPFGSTGPMANQRASELEVQGYSAQWRYVGDLNREPIRVGVPIGAMSAALFAFQGIMAALIERYASGKGQFVEVTQLGSQLTMQTVQLVSESEPDEWIGHCLAPFRAPNHGYQTADQSILWGFSNDQPAMTEFCRRLGLSEEFSRTDAWNNDVARPIFNEAFTGHPSDELIGWVRELGGNAVPYHTYSSLVADPQAQALGLISQLDYPGVGTIGTIGLPWLFSDSVAVHGRPPLLGEHTTEALRRIDSSPSC